MRAESWRHIFFTNPVSRNPRSQLMIVSSKVLCRAVHFARTSYWESRNTYVFPLKWFLRRRAVMRQKFFWAEEEGRKSSTTFGRRERALRNGRRAKNRFGKSPKNLDHARIRTKNFRPNVSLSWVTCTIAAIKKVASTQTGRSFGGHKKKIENLPEYVWAENSTWKNKLVFLRRRAESGLSYSLFYLWSIHQRLVNNKGFYRRTILRYQISSGKI